MFQNRPAHSRTTNAVIDTAAVIVESADSWIFIDGTAVDPGRSLERLDLARLNEALPKVPFQVHRGVLDVVDGWDRTPETDVGLHFVTYAALYMWRARG
jgi:hypothetical protein